MKKEKYLKRNSISSAKNTYKLTIDMTNCKRIKGYQCICGTILLDFPKHTVSENFHCPSCSLIIGKVRMVKCRKNSKNTYRKK